MKLTRYSITRSKHRKNGRNIDGEYPFCNNRKNKLNHLFKTCDPDHHMVRYQHSLPNPNNMELHLIDWLKHIWIRSNWYNQIFCKPLEKVITILCLVGNIEIVSFFTIISVNPADVIEHLRHTYHHMLY